MPSVSKAQHRLMEAAAHTKGGYGGVPQKVGQDYAAADASRSTKKLPDHVKKQLAAKLAAHLRIA